VPIRANLSSVGIIAMPESAIEESNIDVLYREAISAVWDAAGAGTHFGVCSGRSRTRAGRTVGGSSAAGCWHSRACGLPRLVSGSVSHYCLSHANARPLSCPSTIAQSLQATRATDRRAAKLRCFLYPCVRRRPGATTRPGNLHATKPVGAVGDTRRSRWLQCSGSGRRCGNRCLVGTIRNRSGHSAGRIGGRRSAWHCPSRLPVPMAGIAGTTSVAGSHKHRCSSCMVTRDVAEHPWRSEVDCRNGPRGCHRRFDLTQLSAAGSVCRAS